MHLLKTMTITAALALFSISAFADEELSLAVAYYSLDNIVLFGSAVLVLFMQAGFAALESGMSPVNNTVNIMFKNFTDLCVGVLLFYFVGYSIMYGSDASGGLGLFGWGGFGIGTELTLMHRVPVFCIHRLTGCSRLLLQRLRPPSCRELSWAGCSSAHTSSTAFSSRPSFIRSAVSGNGAVAGSISSVFMILQAPSLFTQSAASLPWPPPLCSAPRSAGSGKTGKPRHLQGHSLALAASGVLILWVGWYGFNPGSQLAFAGEANIHATMTIAVNTTLAAGAGGVAAMVMASLLAHSHKLSLAMLFNGVVAGLVGITANCDSVSNPEAIIIGLVAGVLVVLGVSLLNRFKIDDVVGAWPAHGLCGVWGGIATGIFGGYDLGVQILGSLVIPAWAFITMYAAVCNSQEDAGMLRVSLGA